MEWIAYGVLGRLMTWMLQTTPLLNPLFSKTATLLKLRSCDFCLGFWVFAGLAYVLGLNLLTPIYVPILSEAVTGLAVSFLVHLARLGWQTKFQVVNLGEWNDSDP